MRKLLLSLLLPALLLSKPVFAGNAHLDSVMTMKDDTNKVKSLNEIAWSTLNSDPAIARTIAEKSLEVAKHLGWKKGEADASHILAWIESITGNIDGSKKLNERALQIRLELNDQNGVAKSYINLGLNFSVLDKKEEAMKYYNKAEKILLQTGNKKTLAVCYNNIASCYHDLGMMSKAIDYYFKGYKLNEQNNNPEGVASAANNIGIVYRGMGQSEKAREYFQKALSIKRMLGNKVTMVSSLINLGTLYFDKGVLDSALIYITEGKKLAEETGNVASLAGCLNLIGVIEGQKRDFAGAESSLKKSIELSRSINDEHTEVESKYYLGHVYNLWGKYKQAELLLLEAHIKAESYKDIRALSDISYYLVESYENQHDPANTLKYYREYVSCMDSIKTTDTRSEVVRNEMQYAFGKKQLADSLRTMEEKKVTDVQLRHEKVQRYFLYGGITLVLVFSFFILNRFHVTRKQNRIIEEQKAIVEEKNKDITDSINYAKRIQEAIFPEKELKYRIFPDAFVFFRPRDVVSGDFYWFGEQGGKRIIAAVDCTGHGVPGAFMSMIGNAFLNEIIHEKKIIEPGRILDELRDRIISSLKQNEGESSKDGMDISICVFENDFSAMQFAGANNPCWIVRQGNVIEIAPDKQPIGMAAKTAKPFTNHIIELQKNDSVYIFTDGYADQFGGENSGKAGGKKFKYRSLQEKLVNIQDQRMSAQEKILEDTILNWMGTLEQIDDILVIGVRV